jgi:uncharacterized protein YceH (UPF0502 family)
MNDSQPPAEAAVPAKRWQPLSAIDRRVAGVLVEKAKTTPDAYPMSINAIVAGCNQKSNRHPLMNLEADDVEASLDRLRALGAAAVLQGGGRVSRYRHYLYEWLGVEKTEMAVMVELLLRGAQTEGELRGRAARMEPIADVAALRPVLNSLKDKGLLVSLTSEGRGHMVTHNLYEPRELERLKSQYASTTPVDMGQGDLDEDVEIPSRSASPAGTLRPAAAVPRPAPPVASAELVQLQSQVALLRDELDELKSSLRDCRAEVDHLKQQLGV